MLTSHEERVWEDIQRSWTEGAEEPPRLAPSPTNPTSRAQADVLAAVGVGVGVGVRIVIVLLLFGAAQAALAVAAAPALGWTLWHHWPRLTEQGGSVTSPDVGNDTTTCGPTS